MDTPHSPRPKNERIRRGRCNFLRRIVEGLIARLIAGFIGDLLGWPTSR